MIFQNIESSHSTTRFSKGKGPRSVFVLGAGFSMPIGLPSARALLENAQSWSAKSGANVKTNLVDEFCQYMYPRVHMYSPRDIDIEDLLGMMDAVEAYDDIRGSSRGYKWRRDFINNARNQLTRLICEFLWSFQTRELSSRIGYIRRIVRHFSSNTVFVNFNYDLLLETALSAENLEFSYAIDKLNQTRNVILKPHGSINWSTPSPHARYRKWQNENCINFLDQIHVYDGLLPSFLKTVNPPYYIVTPTPNKQIESEFLRHVWTSFSSAIHGCRNVIIVGYSLPAADRLARIVLRRAGPPHHTNRNIVVIDPGDVQRHYRETVSKTIRYVGASCEEFFENCDFEPMT